MKTPTAAMQCDAMRCGQRQRFYSQLLGDNPVFSQRLSSGLKLYQSEGNIMFVILIGWRSSLFFSGNLRNLSTEDLICSIVEAILSVAPVIFCEGDLCSVEITFFFFVIWLIFYCYENELFPPPMFHLLLFIVFVFLGTMKWQNSR